MDELLDLLAAYGYGATICDIFCGASIYADDIALISDSPIFLQVMLDIVFDYATKCLTALNHL